MCTQAYDSHCNLVLGEVEETIYVVEDDDDENDELKVTPISIHEVRRTIANSPLQTVNRKSEMLFVRGMNSFVMRLRCGSFANGSAGDSVVLISPHTGA